MSQRGSKASEGAAEGAKDGEAEEGGGEDKPAIPDSDAASTLATAVCSAKTGSFAVSSSPVYCIDMALSKSLLAL